MLIFGCLKVCRVNANSNFAQNEGLLVLGTLRWSVRFLSQIKPNGFEKISTQIMMVESCTL